MPNSQSALFRGRYTKSFVHHERVHAIMSVIIIINALSNIQKDARRVITYNINNSCPITGGYQSLCRQKSGENDLTSRLNLDRRRFEAAHLKCAMLKTRAVYPELQDEIPVGNDVAEILRVFTPNYYEAFCQKYSGIKNLHEYYNNN